MDLPVWQALYEEMGSKGFVPIAVAFDSAGTSAVEPWIKSATPTYPCLVDRHHVVAGLYDMVNVPTAVWIDEQGRIVRPPEPAGVNDAFRKMDREDFSLAPEVLAQLQQARTTYLEALRDWIRSGPSSRYALSEQEVIRRMRTPDRRGALAAANFRLGQHLFEVGHEECAFKFFDEARRLRPESWNYKRQAWALDDPARAAGPDFWSAVDALGEDRYYPVIEDI